MSLSIEFNRTASGDSSLYRFDGFTFFCDDRPKWAFQFEHGVQSQYVDFPWPKSMQNIAIVTEVLDGSGDISAAAKVVDLIRNLSPMFDITWRVCTDKHEPKSFLNSSDLSKIHIITDSSTEKPAAPADFLITGPWNTWKSSDEIEVLYGNEIKGPRFNFIEFGHFRCTDLENLIFYQRMELRREFPWPWPIPADKIDEQYRLIHTKLFSESHELGGGIMMGLRNRAGLLIDENRAFARLSRQSCCPSYVQNIEDKQLKIDVLSALGVKEENQLPDYDQVSLSFGYAHFLESWKRFISFVAIQEQKKQVVIVLNQNTYYLDYSIEDFSVRIFTPDFLNMLRNNGYGKIRVKGVDEQPFLISNGEASRTLEIVIRPSFSPRDVKSLQLASDQLLSTGDNSAVESWAARCSLYLYECRTQEKEFFLDQQVKAAEGYPIFARFLKLTSKREEITQSEMKDIIALLRNPELRKQTLAFCEHVVIHHSFKNTLIGALKRTAWHHKLPNLISVEADAIDMAFKKKVVTCLHSVYWFEGYSDFGNLLYKVKQQVQAALPTTGLLKLNPHS